MAEELAAETFARAFRARRQFDGRHPSALPWLYGIAANLMRMHVRSEQRRLRAYGEAAERGVAPGSTAEVDARIDAGALAPVLSRALAALNTADREVLLLSAIAELTPAEIGIALHLPGPTIRKRLHRARNRVAEHLRRAGYEPGTYATQLIREPFLPPRLTAAFYRLIAGLPSVQLIGATVGPLGRAGVAVSLNTGPNQRTELIFDPATGVLLSERFLAISRTDGRSAATVVAWCGIDDHAVVRSDSAFPPPARRTPH